MAKELIPEIKIKDLILTIRGERVLLDADLAKLYGVTTSALNQAVKRNKFRFPDPFLFQLTKEEKEEVVTNCDNLRKIKYSPRLPYVFSEHGVLMAATVLNSARAVHASIYIVKTFMKMREFFAGQSELGHKLAQLENRVSKHDEHIKEIVKAIRVLTAPPLVKTRKIGFGRK